jgi:arylsulfatase A-like enzyme
MNRRRFLQSALGACPLAWGSAQTGASRPPNFIIILADDQGYGDLGCYGSPHIRTPNIDRMAREGARFTDFYAQPLCGPSRAALMTGCYPVRNSLMFNHLPRARTGIHRDERTIAEVLKPRGYATMMIGKWHLGDAPPFLPTRHGFDSYFGLPYSNDMWPFHPKIQPTSGENPRLTEARRHAESTGYDGQGQIYPTGWFPDLPLMSNEEIVELNPDQRKLTSTYTEKALEFIRANRSRPFFLYLAHAMPHVPLFSAKSFEGRSLRGLYDDVVEELDSSAGRILDTLKETGLDGNTLVIFTSDNGPWLPYGIDAGSAGPLRGGKGTVWEGGIRVPAILRWPGRVPDGQVISEVAASIDILPSLAHLAGAALPNHTIDGRNLWPLLTQRGAPSPHEAFYYYDAVLPYKAEEGRPQPKQAIKAIRSGRWKLFLEGSGTAVRGSALYDLYSDVSETKDVHARHPEVVRKLENTAGKFDAEISAHVRPLGVL